MHPLHRLPLVLLLLLAGPLFALGCAQPVDEAVDRKAVEEKVDAYVRSVSDADPVVGASVWGTTADVTSITPFGRIVGWESIRQQLYVDFLQKAFRERQLKRSNLNVRVDGDVAWAAFEWTFEATQADGQPMASRGFETQVYRRGDEGWRIAHMHYSGELTSAPAAAAP